MKPDVLIVWPNRPRQMAMLEETYRCHHHHNSSDPDRLMDEVGSRIRAVVASGEKGPTRAMIDKMPNLEIVATYGVGIDATDRKACAERNIPITNTPDVLTEDVADMGLILTLAVLRQIVVGDRYVREGRWPREGVMHLTTTPRGRTMGILGLGRIGKALARRAEAIGMKVIYHTRRPQADVAHKHYGDLVAMAEDSDVLVLCCPGGADTQGMVNARVLEALGPRGYLVNIARGSVVDEPALIEALVTKKIAGAGVDVFANEPHVPEALFALDNVVLQPHAASATEETREAMAQLVVDNLAAHFAGKPLLTRAA